MTGSLSVLNVGAGDIEVVFNQHDQAETNKALQMLVDMQQRGYAILVRLDDGSYVRAKSIDASLGRYIIQIPDGASHAAAEPVDVARQGTCACGCGGVVAEGKAWIRGHHNRKAKRGRVAVPVRKAHAVGVARSAGG
jgi:hypothetical protein